MSDLGPAVVAVVGTAVGASVTGFFAYQQSRLQERSLARRLDHERDAADKKHRVAAAAERAAHERSALVAFGEAVHRGVAGSATYAVYAEVRRHAYQVDDSVLHELVEAHDLTNPALLARAGYLLRTDAADRTPDGHAPPSPDGTISATG